MKSTVLLAAVLLATVPAAQAGMKSVCNHGDQTRVIEVVYPQGGVVPCDVVYTKDSGASVLWSAQNESGFCEQKAEAFVQKQRGWGWHCETSMTDISAADIQPEATADDAVAEPAETTAGMEAATETAAAAE
jgi:hypothetical protein